MGFLEVLTCIFVVLKILGEIDWSWWWVFSPFWIGYPSIIFIYCCLVLIFGLLGENKMRSLYLSYGLGCSCCVLMCMNFFTTYQYLSILYFGFFLVCLKCFIGKENNYAAI